MNTRIVISTIAALAASSLWAASAKPDVLPSPRRQPTVETAKRLSQPPVPAPVPGDLTHLFNPADFNAPDPDEQRAIDAARAAGQPAPVNAPVVLGDRELLETIAARIQPTGSIVARGKALLTFPGRTPTVGVGQSFVVTYDGRDHELEIVSIDRTTFTLRYRGEEITRPIKPIR